MGIRNVSSSNREDYAAARTAGLSIFSVRHLRKGGIQPILDTIPENTQIYLTIDIDAFDPSIAAGTGTPSHGGFLYYEVLELLKTVTLRNRIIGMDLVEVAPDYDHSGSTSFLAAQLLLNIIGSVFHAHGISA